MPQTTLLSYFAAPALQIPESASVKETNECVAELIKANTAEDQKKTSTTDSLLEKAKGPLNSDANIQFIIIPHMPKAIIARIQTSHLPKLKSITATLLPIRYSDKFFNGPVQDEVVAALSRVVLYESKPIGWIRCQLEPSSSPHGKSQIYIQALGLLAPYRGNGLASALISEITQNQTLDRFNVGSIYAHVWESNPDAVDWYEKRGFRRVLLIEQYYRRLRPAGAWIMRKEINPVSTTTEGDR